MVMFEKIIVAIDESEMNQKVIKAAIGIAKDRDVHMTLVNVSKETVPAGLQYVPADYMEELLTEMRKASKALLAEAKSYLSKQGDWQVETITLQGDPAHGILDYAKDHDQQLIIIGSRGLGGMKGVMLGSVSHKVSQLSACPVLIVH